VKASSVTVAILDSAVRRTLLLTSRFDRVAAFALPVMAVLAVFAVAPTANAAAVPAVTIAAAGPQCPSTRPQPLDSIRVIIQYGPVSAPPIERGYFDICVYPDHSKFLRVCDTKGDNREVTLQVDPATAEPIEYQDPDGSVTPACLVHTIGYSVQKFRAGYHEEGNATVAVWWGDWFNRERLGGVPSWPW
jgi:hypothetical protein